MTKEDLNKYAYAETMPETDLTCPQRCLWYALRDVYRRYRAGEINRDQGEKEKKKAFRQYELDAGVMDSARRILKHNASMWTEIELAGSAYATERTLKNADAFIQAVYGCRMKGKEDAA